MRARVVLILLFALYAAPASAIPILSIQPATSNVTVGSDFSVDIMIADAVDVYAFQFDIGFDPAFLSAISTIEGSFLSGGGSTIFIPGEIDNAAGTISFTGNTLVGEIPGVNGAGLLATITFSALAGGTSALTLFNEILLDSTLSEIDSIIANGSVTATADTARVPEPSTLLLLGPALAGAGLLRRRKPRK